MKREREGDINNTGHVLKKSHRRERDNTVPVLKKKSQETDRDINRERERNNTGHVFIFLSHKTAKVMRLAIKSL